MPKSAQGRCRRKTLFVCEPGYLLRLIVAFNYVVAVDSASRGIGFGRAPRSGRGGRAPVDTACFQRNTNIYCRAIGAKPGTDMWAQCVLAPRCTTQREYGHIDADASGGQRGRCTAVAERRPLPPVGRRSPCWSVLRSPSGPAADELLSLA
jgi:hypothetical protein